MTTYAVLELFADPSAEDRIGVEGFDSLDGLANFVLFAATELHPRWRTVRADTHDDVRKVLSMLDTIEATARFLVGLDYEDAEVRRTLTAQFPAGDVDAAMQEAHEHKRRLDAEVDAVMEREADAAKASELDLDRSIHDA